MYSNCKPEVHKGKNYERHLRRIAMQQCRRGSGIPKTTDGHVNEVPKNTDEHGSGMLKTTDRHGSGMPKTTDRHGMGYPRPQISLQCAARNGD